MYQLTSFAYHYAQEGNKRAHQLLYDQFEANLANGRFEGAHYPIYIDGVKGHLYLANRLGEFILRGQTLYDWYLPYLVDLEDEEQPEHLAALEQAAAENERIRAYLAAVREEEAEEERSHRRKRRKLNQIPYQELREAAFVPQKRDELSLDDWDWKFWGRDASDEDIRQAAADLLTIPETQITVLQAYLGMFRLRAFPLEPDTLIEWAKRDWGDGCDRHVPSVDCIPLWAFNALKEVQHPKVRAAALEMLGRDDKVHRAIDLLVNNYQEGDWKRIEALVKRNLKRFTYHGLGLGILNIFESHPSPEAVPTLIHLYEHGPCSTCRRRAVEALYSLNALPDWMREECRYDANPDIRQFIEEHSGQLPE